MTTEPKQEAERIVEELGRNSYEHALHNYDGLTLDAGHSRRRQELRRLLVDALAAAIELDDTLYEQCQFNKLVSEKWHTLREALSALREDV